MHTQGVWRWRWRLSLGINIVLLLLASSPSAHALDLLASDTIWVSPTDATRTVTFAPTVTALVGPITSTIASSTSTAGNVTLAFPDFSGNVSTFRYATSEKRWNLTPSVSVNANDVGIIQIATQTAIPNLTTRVNTFANEADTTTILNFSTPGSGALQASPANNNLGSIATTATTTIPATSLLVACDSVTTQLNPRLSFRSSAGAADVIILRRDMYLLSNPVPGFIKLSWGTNAAAGTGTLTAGTAFVATNLTTYSARIMLFPQGMGPGDLRLSTKDYGVGFTVVSNNASDVRDFYWQIWENSVIVPTAPPATPTAPPSAPSTPTAPPSGTSPSTSPSPPPPPAAPNISGGAIAGIVIGSVAAGALLAGLIAWCNSGSSSSSSSSGYNRFGDSIVPRSARRRPLAHEL